MSGPPCGELNAYLSEKYAAIRREEERARKAAEMDAFMGMCMAFKDDFTANPVLDKTNVDALLQIFKQDIW